VDIHRKTQVIEPAVAISTSGRVGVMWYDFTGHKRGDRQLLTHLWLGRMTFGGATASFRQIVTPFDMRTATPIGGGDLGDYQALLAVPQGFQAVYTAAKPMSVHGATDIFAASLPY